MNPTFAAASMSTGRDLRRLDGKIVLVKSSRDHRNPQAAVRGTIVVHEAASPPEVVIEFDVPQMFRQTAHHRSLRVEPRHITQLLESETEGVFEYTTDEPLD